LKSVGQAFQKLSSYSLSTSTIQAHSLQYWRERIYGYMLAAMLVLGLFALVPSVWMSLVVGYYGLAVFDVLAYLFVVGLFFLHGASYTLRAILLLAIGLSVGIIVFIVTGDEGAGFFWIFMVPPLASMLLGLNWGSVFLAVNIAIVAGIGVLISLRSPLLPRLLEFSVESWVVYAVNFVATNAIVTLPLGALLNGLFVSVEHEKQAQKEVKSGEESYRRIVETAEEGI